MGGNVFKDKFKNSTTGPIKLEHIAPTTIWLENLTGLILRGYELGSVGKKSLSNDLDFVVNPTTCSIEKLCRHVESYCKSQGLDPRDNIKRAGQSVHFRCPIAGESTYVQADFFFSKYVEWITFTHAAPGDSSQYSGADRFVIIKSLANYHGFEYENNFGLTMLGSRGLFTRDPDYVAELLLGSGTTRKDFESVESIIAALTHDPERNDKLKDAVFHFSRAGVSFPLAF